MGENNSLSPQKNLLTIFGSFVLIFIAIDKIAAFYVPTDLTIGFWAASIVTVGAVLALEILVFKRSLSAAFQFLGFGRPDGRTLTITAIIGLITLLFFPIFSAITDVSVSMPDNWLWKLSGIVAIHGIAEEVLFRGFLFHHLRAGRTFNRAAFLSLLAFAVAHVYLFTYMPAPLASFATLLSLASAYPFAYLFERGNNTIWAPALMHVSIHAVSFFNISEPHVMTAGVVWMTVWMLTLVLIYVLRKRLFESEGRS
jgi:membrane protease YdiL (CAAX protease family)